MKNEWGLDEARIRQMETAIRKARSQWKKGFFSELPVPKDDLEAVQRFCGLKQYAKQAVESSAERLRLRFGFDARSPYALAANNMLLENQEFEVVLMVFAMLVVAHVTVEERLPRLIEAMDKDRKKHKENSTFTLIDVYMKCVRAIERAWDALFTSVRYQVSSHVAHEVGTEEDRCHVAELACAHISSLINPRSDSKLYAILKRENDTNIRQLIRQHTISSLVGILPDITTYKGILKAPYRVEREIEVLISQEIDRRKSLGKRKAAKDRVTPHQIDVDDEMSEGLLSPLEEFWTKQEATLNKLQADEIWTEAPNLLSAGEWEVFRLKYGREPKTEVEIAAEIDRSVGHVRRCAARAIEKLRKRFLAA